MAFVTYFGMHEMQLIIYPKGIKRSSNVTGDAEETLDIRGSIAIQMVSLLKLYYMY